MSQSLCGLVLDSKTGGTPYSPLLIGADGQLYGTTRSGTSSNGAIFTVSPQGGKVEVLHQFSGRDGSGPFSGLIAGRNGVLYGTTDFGGSQKIGVVFAYKIKGRRLTIVHSFNTADGAYPQAGIAVDHDGRLLGTTFSGGSDNGGTIYRCDLKASSFQVLQDLSPSVAGIANAGLTYAGGKTFFGRTLSGGPGQFAAGTIIRFSE